MLEDQVGYPDKARSTKQSRLDVTQDEQAGVYDMVAVRV